MKESTEGERELISRFFDYFKDFKLNKKTRFIGILVFSLPTVVFFIIFRNIVFSLFLSICIVFVFLEIVSAMAEKRAVTLNNQLMEFIVNMIVKLRAGKTVRKIIKEDSSLLKTPLGNYIKILSGQLDLNISFDSAMDDFVKNCATRETLLLVTALKLNNRIGGDLVFILDNIIGTLRDSLKVKSSINTSTLQSRYSGSIIAIMPVIILVFMFFAMSNSLHDFFSSKAGNISLIAGALLEIAGIIVIRKILGAGRTDGI